MGYIVTEEVSDDGISKRGKTLLGALAYVMDSNAQSGWKKSEFRSLAHTLQSTRKKLEEAQPKQESAQEMTSSVTDSLEKQRLEAEKAIGDLEAEKEKNLVREKYLQKALVDEGYFEWRNRSIKVETYGRYRDHTFKNEDTDDYRKIWQVDCEMTMKMFMEDLKELLPEGVPEKAFDATYFHPRPSNSKSTVGLVSFNEVYEEAVREAIVKMAERNLERVSEVDPEKIKQLNLQGGLSKSKGMCYDDAVYLASSMPYMIETDTPSPRPGKLTLDVLRGPDGMEVLKETAFNVQTPLLNISEFAKKDEKLRSFREEAFGGSIGRDEKGFVRAMNICMGKYAEQQAQKVDFKKVLASIDREMEKGLGRKGEELSI